MAAARLAEMKLFIDYTAMLNIMDLRAKARKLKRDHDVQFLVIDYLQLCMEITVMKIGIKRS